jgi:DNA-binding transcriptional MerR regulator
MPALFTIGRFSRLVRLSVRSLRRYDALGLLRPAHVDPATGYRRYTLEQVRDAEAIRLLRELGVPLAVVGEILGDLGDRGAVGARLEAHLARLEAEIEAQRERVRRLQAVMTQDDPFPTQPVIEQRQSPQPVASIRFRTSHRSVDTDVAEAFASLAALLADAGVTPAGDPLLVLHAVIDETTDGDLEVAIPVRGPDLDRPEIPGRTLPGAHVIQTRHRGPIEEIAAAYHVLGAWSAVHDLQAAGPPREIFRSDPTKAGPSGLEVDVLWPVRHTRRKA